MFSAFLQWVFYLHTSHTLTNCDLFLEETNQLWFVKCGLGLSIILFEGFWQEVDCSKPIMASKVWGHPGHKQNLELLTLAENLSAWIDHTIYLFRSRLYIRNQLGIEKGNYKMYLFGAASPKKCLNIWDDEFLEIYEPGLGWPWLTTGPARLNDDFTIGAVTAPLNGHRSLWSGSFSKWSYPSFWSI